jgi:anthranilate phosphoribosyltransferase
MSLLPFLHRVVDQENLTAMDAEQAMRVILEGQAEPTQISAFLTALRMKKETDEEVLGFARAMRAMATSVDAGIAGEPLLDIVGTGGDGHSTFNISTTSSFVVAGAGVRVAKHGNRSISSRCGAADVLEALGVKLIGNPEQIGRAIREVGIGFLYAPALHPAMKHAQPVRRELKMRTVFNLLGPLTNPAGATRQVVGAPSADTAALIAKVLASLGLARALVVYGSDGMDEITTTGPTLALDVHSGAIAHRDLTPADFGLPVARIEDLRGGDASENVKIVQAVLAGEQGPKRDIVLANSAAALVTAGRASDFREGVEIAADSIDSGAAWRKVEGLAKFTSQCA